MPAALTIGRANSTAVNKAFIQLREIDVEDEWRLKTVEMALSYLHDDSVPTYSPHRQHEALVALGDAIRRIRKEKGISQESLALKAEIDRSYLGRIERGDSVVALLVLITIADALELKLEQLIHEAKL